MKIVIAPNAFKGTLSASEAAHWIHEGMKKVLLHSTFIEIPMADGGEGTVNVLIAASHGKILTARVQNPLGKEIDAPFGIMGDGKAAVIEMAAASGLVLIPKTERNPLIATTFGTGQMIKAALDKGVSQIILGIGGSATVDGGAGMAQSLGVQLKDRTGKELPYGGQALQNLATMDMTGLDARIEKTRFLVACDVENPLLGAQGAAKVYGPQKGATPEMVEILENALANFASVIKRDIGLDVASLPGGGAAGGLGAGLVAFCRAKLERGFEIVASAVKLEEYISSADLVITGEGRIDYQTPFGKTPSCIAALAKKYNIPVIAIGGSLGKNVENVLACGIDAYFSALCAPMSEEEILQNAPAMLSQCSEQIARLLCIARDICG
jgi:glycerate kinase